MRDLAVRGIMRAVRLAGLLSVVFGALSLAGCGDFSWKQKVTVVVDTPDGPKTGSSVMEVRRESGLSFLGADAGNSRLRMTGEAPVVDLGGGRYLFALLRGMDSKIYDVLVKQGAQPGMAKLRSRIVGMRDPLVLDKVDYPLLVTFGDIADPASVKNLEPQNIEAAFGPGYRLNSITVTITDEPLMKGKVKSILPWLIHYYNKRFDGQRFGTVEASNPFANSLASGAFDTVK